jgi:hypothetical protein
MPSMLDASQLPNLGKDVIILHVLGNEHGLPEELG